MTGRRWTPGTLLATVVLAATVSVPRSPAAAGIRPAGTGGSALVGGSALGHGIFVTYSDKETVIEGGTVVPPDAAVAQAEANIDLTGRGSALAALGYSPYGDAPGLINAFAGTELPFAKLGEGSRAKVSGSPTQEAEAPAAGARPAGRARARIVDGPKAEADTAAVDGGTGGITVTVGSSHAVVDTARGAADAGVTVVLRQVTVGSDLVIDTVRLAVRAVADGAAGIAAASTTVEGVTVRGQPVRLTPRGVEPVAASPAGAALPSESGIEVVAAGSETSRPGGDQAEARATGPRLRLSSSDGRVLEVVIGQAAASSTRMPPDDRTDQSAAGWGAALAAPDPKERSSLVDRFL